MVSFIIPVKNDAARLARCLASIRAFPDALAREVVVVDNGSTDDSAAVAREAGARVLSIPGQRVSALRNAAAALARGQLLAFVDADHELGASWLTAAIEVMQPEKVGAAGALYVAPCNGTWVQRTYGALRGQTRGQSETRWLGSGNLIVRRDVFEALGGFDRGLESCEDVDFCQRLRQAGWKLIADERLLSVHHGDPSTLTRLFRAERWRGRDNLRVTFRTRLSVRDMPSIATPILIALLVPVCLAGVALAPFVSTRAVGVALSAATVVGVLVFLRTLKISHAARDWSPRSILQALAVAATYELARGVALMTLAPHHREATAPPPSPARASTK